LVVEPVLPQQVEDAPAFRRRHGPRGFGPGE
jgi:hypothetical protein